MSATTNQRVPNDRADGVMKVLNDRADAIVAEIKNHVNWLNDSIEKLQNTPGPITPNDQTLLDVIELRGDAIATELDALIKVDVYDPLIPQEKVDALRSQTDSRTD